MSAANARLLIYHYNVNSNCMDTYDTVNSIDRITK